MAKRKLTQELRENTTKALVSQFPINQYGFPFTLNPTIGCYFGCKYCYSPSFLYGYAPKQCEPFFENVAIKLNIAETLDKELTKLRVLPQNLKRVQINETSDYYLPQILSFLKQHKRDVMLEILQIFEKHWNQGNRWMLHILTKSHLILNHLEQLVNMRQMVQVEISICSADENLIRKLEFYTPSIKRRLETIKTLASNGIFVRVMAMPFYGNEKDVEAIKRMAFENGAKGFKNKSLNYFDWDQLKDFTYEDLIADKVKRVSYRTDSMIEELNEKSGEYKLFDGLKKSVIVSFPKQEKWNTVTKLEQKLSSIPKDIINCGYSEMNDVDWEYIQ